MNEKQEIAAIRTAAEMSEQNMNGIHIYWIPSTPTT